MIQNRKVKVHSLQKDLPANSKRAKIKKLDVVLYIITLLCLCLLVWSINIYRNTFIDWKILGPPTIIGCIITTSIFWRSFLKAHYSLRSIFFICFLCGGSLTHFGFMYLNQKFAKKKMYIEIFSIEKKGKFASDKHDCKSSYAQINFHGMKKNIVFSCADSDMINSSNKVKISYASGLFGYNVITEKILFKK